MLELFGIEALSVVRLSHAKKISPYHSGDDVPLFSMRVSVTYVKLFRVIRNEESD